MTTSDNNHGVFGALKPDMPTVVFRASSLNDSVRVLPDQTKRQICGEWLRCVKPPVFIDVDFDERNILQLDTIGRILTRLDATPDEILIHLKLAKWHALRMPVGMDAIRQQLDQARLVLGKRYSPGLVSVPAAAGVPRGLAALKTDRKLAGVGVALVDSQSADRPLEYGAIDFITLETGPSILQQPTRVLDFLAAMAARRIPIISAGVFCGGFLVGGSRLNGRKLNSDDAADQSLLTWRKAFTSLCHGHGVRPAHACIQFALSVPGVAAVSLSTSNRERVAQVVSAATTPVPNSLWVSMKEEGLLAEEFPYVGKPRPYA